MGVAQQACRVAIIGAGGMAREHARAFADIPGVALAGIYSRTADRARVLASELGIREVAGSVEELFDRTHADLVVVTVPELAANSVIRQCLAFPWALLVEKPAGYNLADAEDIAGAVRAANAHAFVALNRRHYSSTLAAVADLDAQPDRRFIRIQDQQDQCAALAAGQPAAVVENWMYANSIHTIDYLKLFGRGDVVSVESVERWSASDPSIVIAKVEFSSGDIGLYEGIWDGPGPWAVTVSTPERRWEMRPLETASYQDRGQRVLHPVEIDAIDKQFKTGFRRQAELAVNAARGVAVPLPTVHDALETMRLIARIFG